MINYLKDVSKSTPIGMLPDVINFNNDSIESEFNNIYNSSLNRLTKSVYAPTGSVKAHFGEFVNLSAEYITVKNVDSLKNTIQSCVDEMIIENSSEHSLLKGRFSNSDIEREATEYSSQTQQTITHDAGTIYIQRSADAGYSAETLSDTISDIDSTIQDLSTKVLDNNIDINSRVDNIDLSINDLSNNINNTYAYIEDISSKLADDIIALKEHVKEAHIEVENISTRIVDVSNYLTTIDSSISNISTYTQYLADEIQSLDISTLKSYYQAGQNITITKNELETYVNINAIGYAYDTNHNFIFDNGQDDNFSNKVSNSAIGAVVSGYNSTVSGNYSHAEGQSIASGQGSHAEGNATEAKKAYAHSEGYNTLSNGDWAHAEGITTTTYGSGSHTEGQETITRGSGSHAEGYKSVAYSGQSHAEGNSTSATGSCAHSEGYITTAEGVSSHAEGNNSKARGNYAHSEGAETYANSEGSHTEGIRTQANASYGHAEGSNTIVNAYGGHAEGKETEVNGQWSHAEGQSTITNGYAAHAEGQKTIASGNFSHAEGSSTNTNANYSHAEGYNTSTNDVYTHAEGENTNAKRKGSHAEGKGTISEGYYSHSEGLDTVAHGEGSHAEGSKTLSDGNYSHSEGLGTWSYAEGSHAEGNSTIANMMYQHVSGEYNIADDSQYYVIVGNGTSDTARSNAATISKTGTIWSKEDIKCGGENQDDATYSLVDLSAVVANKVDSIISGNNVEKQISIGQATSGNSIVLSYDQQYGASSRRNASINVHDTISLGVNYSSSGLKNSSINSDITISDNNIVISVNDTGDIHTLVLDKDNIDKINYIITNYDKINYILADYWKLEALYEATAQTIQGNITFNGTTIKSIDIQ